MDKIQSLSYFNDHALRWFEWKQVHQTHAFTLMRTFSTAFSTNYQVFSKLVLTFQECVWCCCVIIILNSSYFLFTLGVKKRGRKKKHQRFKLWMLYCSCTCRIFSFEYIASDGINFKCFLNENQNSITRRIWHYSLQLLPGLTPTLDLKTLRYSLKGCIQSVYLCLVCNAEYSRTLFASSCPHKQVSDAGNVLSHSCSSSFSSLHYRVPQFNLLLGWMSPQDPLLTWGYHLQPWWLHPSFLLDLTPHRCLQVLPFLKEINTVFQEGCIELVNSGSKDIML